MEAGTIRRDSRRDTTHSGGNGIAAGLRRRATETKASFKTSEMWLSVAVIVGILVSAAAINGGDTGGTDEFIARHAWLFVAIVTVGYAVSRGLAKSGTGEPYSVDAEGNDQGNASR